MAESPGITGVQCSRPSGVWACLGGGTRTSRDMRGTDQDQGNIPQAGIWAVV
jgi:hypothetical protein